jgi:general secretion pathway protein I
MFLTERSSPARSRGFSLLEMLVAISILGLALGVLYQASTGAMRNVQVDERHAYAVELGRSLLASNIQVPAGGVNKGGETEGGFIWRVSTEPVAAQSRQEQRFLLFSIRVEVAWFDAGKRRQISLDSVVEGIES